MQTTQAVYVFDLVLENAKIECRIIDKKAQWFGPLSYFLILFTMLTYFYNLEGIAGMFLGNKFID